jgi:hypothetical protein
VVAMLALKHSLKKVILILSLLLYDIGSNLNGSTR